MNILETIDTFCCILQLGAIIIVNEWTVQYVNDIKSCWKKKGQENRTFTSWGTSYRGYKENVKYQLIMIGRTWWWFPPMEIGQCGNPKNKNAVWRKRSNKVKKKISGHCKLLLGWFEFYLLLSQKLPGNVFFTFFHISWAYIKVMFPNRTLTQSRCDKDMNYPSVSTLPFLLSAEEPALSPLSA